MHRMRRDVDTADSAALENLTAVWCRHRHAPALHGDARIAARIGAHIELGAEVTGGDVARAYEEDTVATMLDAEGSFADERRDMIAVTIDRERQPTLRRQHDAHAVG